MGLLMIVSVISFTVLVTKFYRDYRRRKMEDDLIETMENQNISTDDLSLFEGSIGTTSLEVNNNHPGNINIQLTSESKRDIITKSSRTIKTVHSNKKKNDVSLVNIEFAQFT